MPLNGDTANPRLSMSSVLPRADRVCRRVDGLGRVKLLRKVRLDETGWEVGVMEGMASRRSALILLIDMVIFFC